MLTPICPQQYRPHYGAPTVYKHFGASSHWTLDADFLEPKKSILAHPDSFTLQVGKLRPREVFPRSYGYLAGLGLKSNYLDSTGCSFQHTTYYCHYWFTGEKIKV